jgi:hypothetical protein
MNKFSIYIPRVNKVYNSHHITEELSLYGYINSIDIMKSKYSDNFNSVFVHFVSLNPIKHLNGRNLKEDTIYRESNGLKPLKHKNSLWEKWTILRNKSNAATANAIDDDYIVVDNIYGYGL